MSKHSRILSELQNKLMGVESLRYVGFAPDNLANVKIKTPAALICDESESYTKLPADTIECFWLISVYVYLNCKNNRLEKLNEVQNKIIANVFDGTCLNGEIANINEAIEIEKGEPKYTQKPDYFTAGYYDNFSIRKISFNLHYFNKLN